MKTETRRLKESQKLDWLSDEACGIVPFILTTCSHFHV